MQKLDVAIVGGGPSGLCAAKAVRTARPDLNVAVFERSDLRPRGAIVFLPPNGVRAIEAIGGQELKERLARHHTVHMKVRRFSPAGEVVFSRDDGGPMQEIQARDGGERILLPWSTLQQELADSLPEGSLHVRHRFLRYTESDDGIAAEFETAEGVKRVHARVLIGCDGGQSMVREQLLGDGPPRYMGMAVWRAMRPRPDNWPVDHGYVGFGSPGLANCLTHTIDGGRTITWQAFAPWPADLLHVIGGGRQAYIQEIEASQAAASGQKSVEEVGRERLGRVLAAFDGYPQVLRDLFASTPPTAVTEHGQLYREVADCQVYARGRVALVGDAAHLSTPFLGQGSSQAIEDALELGRAVGEYGPTPQALAAYERVRLPLSGDVQATSIQMFKDFMAGSVPKSEFEINSEKGFSKRTFAPLQPVAVASS